VSEWRAGYGKMVRPFTVNSGKAERIHPDLELVL
jgi:hypothetical protein